MSIAAPRRRHRADIAARRTRTASTSTSTPVRRAAAAASARTDHAPASSGALVGPTVFILTSLLALAWVAAGQPGLPDHFSNDHGTIAAILQGTYTEADSSFRLIADTYRALGLTGQPALAGLLGVLSYLAALAMALSGRSGAGVRWSDWGLVVSCVALAAIYHGVYTKDLITLGVVAVVLCCRRTGIVSEVLPVVAMLVYAAGFRTYWFLIAGAYVLLRATLTRRRGWTSTLIAVVAIFAALAVIFPQAVGVDLDHFRLSVNEFRTEESVNTIIERFIDGEGPIIGFVNSVLIFASFILPAPLALTGGALYLLVATLLVAVWASLVFAIRAARRAAAPDAAPLTPFQNRLLATLLAVLMMQSIFEPDYGSFLRHLTPLLIVAVALLLDLRRSARHTGDPTRG